MVKDKIKDRLLLYRVQNKKDTQAFAELYDRYIQRIYRFVFFKIESQEETEEIVSDVFLKAWRHLTEGQKEEVYNFNAFLYRIARNSVVDHYRARQRQTETVSLDQIMENELSAEPGANQQALNISFAAQETEDIARHLSGLKDEYKEIITMRYIEELSIGEIATIMEKSELNVRVTIHRALKSLRKLVEKNQ